MNTKLPFLRKERLRKRLTQKQLADLAGVSWSTVERAERGENIRLDSIQRLCEYLNKEPQELGFLGEESNVRLDQTNTLEEAHDADLQQEASSPTRFLTMKAEELIQRYAAEEEHLLKLQTEERAWTLPEVVVFDNRKARLPLTAIRVQLDTSSPEYKISPTIAGKAEDILEELESSFYDSTTIRLNSIQQEDNGLTLIVSKAHFLQYVATNYAMDAFLKEKGWTRSLRDTVHPTKRLCRLEESLLANHIGIGTLVFTSDNYLILPLRSKDKIATWRQTISPSISGATCYDDDMYTKREGPVASWIREGREELGLENSDFAEGDEIFLGITRDLLRGGKPEMFFATRLTIPKARVEHKFKKAKDRWENVELKWREFPNPLTPPSTEQERQVFFEDFFSLLNCYQGHLSRPAQVNFTLWFNYLWST